MKIKKLIYEKRNDVLSIANHYGVVKIQLFGSVARNEEVTDSDIDFLVQFEEGRTLFDLIALKNELEGLLTLKVDVVSEESLHWNISEQVKREVIEI
ncbi:putative nucleotidyltransferase [Alkaliphilus hydrothermalis]|uniref:Nucleotidyltransferase n=1 Tax=Alkaliphilus hydrothermalis TaxID=1482730 RepID=A0ABS2NTA1_9FIRM|nr:putative nucleotidyltransferase [Alkaliphilus hydrothermalis]